MMRWNPSRRVLVLVTLLALAVPALARAQSLAEVARQEQARRKQQPKAGKVYTNTDLTHDYTTPTSGTGDAATTPTTPAPSGDASAAPAPPAPAPGAADAPAADGAGGAEPKKDQAYWKGRIDSAKATLERSKTFADALQTRINSLSADFVNRDDPAQRALIAQERTKTIAELERVQREIVVQTKAVSTIEEDARKQGVPAGWLR